MSNDKTSSVVNDSLMDKHGSNDPTDSIDMGFSWLPSQLTTHDSVIEDDVLKVESIDVVEGYANLNQVLRKWKPKDVEPSASLPAKQSSENSNIHTLFEGAMKIFGNSCMKPSETAEFDDVDFCIIPASRNDSCVSNDGKVNIKESADHVDESLIGGKEHISSRTPNLSQDSVSNSTRSSVSYNEEGLVQIPENENEDKNENENRDDDEYEISKEEQNKFETKPDRGFLTLELENIDENERQDTPSTEINPSQERENVDRFGTGDLLESVYTTKSIQTATANPLRSHENSTVLRSEKTSKYGADPILSPQRSTLRLKPRGIFQSQRKSKLSNIKGKVNSDTFF